MGMTHLKSINEFHEEQLKARATVSVDRWQHWDDELMKIRQCGENSVKVTGRDNGASSR